jgi:alginate O-acetyltransferase complex protein AlgI
LYSLCVSFISLQYPLFYLSLLGGLSWIRASSHSSLLLFASLYFYGASQPELLFFLGWVILFAYLFGREIHRAHRFKRSLLLCALLIVFAPFLAIKFLSPQLLPTALLFPVGISFFTFQAASYLIEIKDGRQGVVSLKTLSLYLSFFPQLIAGPIERPQKLIPQLKNLRLPNLRMWKIGLYEILCGLFKKCVLADRLGLLVDPVYSRITDWDLVTISLATILYGFQIYLDFSAYCQIAVGSASLLGIELSENFHRPYLATSPREFWRRWHKTLGLWFRDYVYIPLGGAQKNTLLALLFVFLLSGIWHGRTVLFILWGFWHFLLYITLEKSRLFKLLRIGKWAGILCTQCGVLAGWSLFRSESLPSFLQIFSQPFFLPGISPLSWHLNAMLISLLICCGVFIVELMAENEILDRRIQRNSLGFRLLITGLIILLGRFEPYEFLYFRF